jgi:3-mercaptopyruvate sulfurtransferase SseA
MERTSRRTKRALLSAAVALALAAAWLWGCGTGGYDAPRSAWDAHPQTLTVTDNALVDPATVRAWVDNGLVNAEADERVVVVEVAANGSSWDSLHVPGALFLNQSLLVSSRAEGVDPALASNELPPGAQMDNLVRSLGIDERTTVVFTATLGANVNQAARGYFTFRYWGFPKERLKVLNGGNGAYLREFGASAMEGLLGGTVAFPSAVPSSFSVRENPSLRHDLRASAGEMIRAVLDNAPNLAVIDSRGGSSGYSQVTGAVGATTVTGTFKAILEGRVRDARWIPPNDIASTAEGAVTGFAGSDNVIRTGAALVDNVLAPRGIDSTKRVYAYCQTGVQASVTFLVLDGVLGWNASVYDGSTSQWGTLSDRAAHRGRLPAGSPWAVDDLTVHGRLDNTLPGPNYIDNASAYSFTPWNPWLPLDDPRMNQIEAEDRGYMASPPAGSGGGTGGAGSSGGGC